MVAKEKDKTDRLTAEQNERIAAQEKEKEEFAEKVKHALSCMHNVWSVDSCWILCVTDIHSDLTEKATQNQEECYDRDAGLHAAASQAGSTAGAHASWCTD